MTYLPSASGNSPIGPRWTVDGATVWQNHALADVADLIASPGVGVWGSSAQVNGAVISGSALSITNNGGVALNYKSTDVNTAYWYYWTAPRPQLGSLVVPTGRVLAAGHIQTDTALGATDPANFQTGSIIVQRDAAAAAGNWVRLNIGNYGAPDSALVARVDYESAAPAAWSSGLTSSSQGAWWRVVAYQGNTGIDFEFADAAHTADPSTLAWAAVNTTPYNIGLSTDTDVRIMVSTLNIGVTTAIQWNHRHLQMGYPEAA